jgi:hypothetical protein
VDALDDALRVIESLNQAGVDYVVVGGVALNLHGLTRLGEATRFADLEAQDIEIEGIRARVATPQTLYRMKRDTVRPIDHADALALRSAFDLHDED